MQLDAREHFTEIVTAAVGEYLEAEAELSAATEAADEDRLRTARFRALRLGGAAAIYLHHFADIVAKRPSKGLPDFSHRWPRCESSFKPKVPSTSSSLEMRPIL